MPGGGEIAAGRAFVELVTRDAGLITGLNSANNRLKSFGLGIASMGLKLGALGSAIFAPLAGAAAAYAEHGAELARASAKTGVAVEALSTLKYAAAQTGTEFESLNGAFTKMGRTIVEAQRGSAQAVTAFAQLGLSVGDLAHMSQDQRFLLIADRISKLHDPAVQAAAAMGIFSRAGAELLPLLSQGSEGIQAMQARARALGLQWSGADAQAAAKFNRTLKDLWDVLKHGSDVIGSAVAPVLDRMARSITSAIVGATQWVSAHRQVFQVAVKVGAGLIVAGAALFTLGTSIALAGVAVSGIVSAFGAVGAVVGAVLSPVALLAAAAAATAGALLVLSGAGGDIIEAFRNPTFANWGRVLTDVAKVAVQAWDDVETGIVSVWKAIGDAASAFAGVASGAITRAVDSMGSFGAVLRQTAAAIGGIGRNVWAGFAAGAQAAISFVGQSLAQIAAVFKAAAGNFAGLFSAVWDSLKFIFNNTTTIAGAWGAIVAEAAIYGTEAWALAKGAIVGLWIELKTFAGQVWAGIGQTILSATHETIAQFLAAWAKATHAWGSLINTAADYFQVRTSETQLKVDLQQIDADQASGKINPQEAERRRALTHKTFDSYDDKQRDQRDGQLQAALDARLAAIRAEADAKKAALDDLITKQSAADAQQTQEERARNAAEIQAAKDTAAKARDAYEAELAQHGPHQQRPPVQPVFTDEGKLNAVGQPGDRAYYAGLPKGDKVSDAQNDAAIPLREARDHAIDAIIKATGLSAEKVLGSLTKQGQPDLETLAPNVDKDQLAKLKQQYEQATQSIFDFVGNIDDRYKGYQVPGTEKPGGETSLADQAAGIFASIKDSFKEIPGIDGLDAILEKLKNLGGGTGEDPIAGVQAKTFSTFNKTALFGIGPQSGAAERTAKATENMARILAQIAARKDVAQNQNGAWQ